MFEVKNCSHYATLVYVLTIAPNVQKWYTFIGTQRSIVVVLWRVIAPHDAIRCDKQEAGSLPAAHWPIFVRILVRPSEGA